MFELSEIEEFANQENLSILYEIAKNSRDKIIVIGALNRGNHIT